MATYANKQDMIDRFGIEEIIQLTDRSNLQTNSINDILLQAKIEDAEAELNLMLACCYNLKIIKEIYVNGDFVPVLKHWVCDITRKHLYDLLENADHQVIREYKDFKEEIAEICKCQILIDSNNNEIPKKNIFYLIDEPACYPKTCECKETCYCGVL